MIGAQLSNWGQDSGFAGRSFQLAIVILKTCLVEFDVLNAFDFHIFLVVEGAKSDARPKRLQVRTRGRWIFAKANIAFSEWNSLSEPERRALANDTIKVMVAAIGERAIKKFDVPRGEIELVISFFERELEDRTRLEQL